jgi:hypothetical protein
MVSAMAEVDKHKAEKAKLEREFQIELMIKKGEQDEQLSNTTCNRKDT